MEESICEVDPSEVRVSPFQPRRHFSEEELEQLSASIRHIGLIQPPVVRKIMQKDKCLYYELIAGERRWRAALRAGLKKIPVIIRDSSDEEAAEASLIENIQRVDLNPIEMAEAFRRLVEVFRLTQEKIAEKVGKKRSTIANYLRLLSLPAPIRESIEKGTISMGHAKAILSLENGELKTLLHELIISNQLTVRDAEDASLKMARKEGGKKGSSSKKEIHSENLEERLEKQLQTKVKLISSKKGGKLVIHYYNLDDLDRLLALLSISEEF